MGYGVLILEDNKTDASLMEVCLKRSQQQFDAITKVKNKKEYKEALSKSTFDLIISDYRLPDINGSEAIKLKNSYDEETPIIIVSGTIGEEKAVELIRDGAIDFLIKDSIQKRLAQVAERAIQESIEKQKRKSAEQDLKRSEKKYSMLFESSLDGIIIGLPDEGGRILDANPSVCDMLGYTHTEFIQLKRNEIIFDDKMQQIKETRHNEGFFIGEIWMLHKNGEKIPVETTSRIVEIDNGELRSFSVLRDIRERKNAENEIKKQREIKELQSDIAQILNENRPFKKSLATCVERINKFLGWDIGHIYIKENKDNSTIIRSSKILTSSSSKKYSGFIEDTLSRTFSPKEGYVGKVAESKSPKIFSKSNMKKGFKRINTIDGGNINSGVLFPITVNGDSAAVLEFYSEKDQVLNIDTQKVLEDAIKQMSLLFERRFSHEKLKEEKDKFKLLAENATDMISRHSEDGTYLYASPACEPIMGYSPEELVGKSAYNFFHPDDLERITHSHSTILDKSDVFTVDYRAKHKNGDWIWVETTSNSLRNPDTGEVYEIHTVTRDISERKKHQQELERQIDLNEKIINSLPGIFFMISKGGNLLRVNEELKKTIGYDPDAEVKHYTDFIVKSDLEIAINSFEEAFTQGHSETELRIITKNGSSQPYLITTIVDKLNEEEYLIGAGIDISERKKAESELLEEKQFIDLAINSLPGLFYVLDEEGNYIRVNDEFINLLGYSWEEIDRMSPLDFYLKEDHEKVNNAIQKAFVDGTASLVSRIKTKDGELPYFYLTGAQLYQNGKNYILGTGIDITSQLKLEKMLDQAHSMAKIGAWELDLIKDEIIWSKVTKEIHEVEEDYEPDLKTAINFYVEGESRNSITEAVEKAIKTGEPYDLELQITTGNNNTKWVRAIGKTEFSDGTCVRLYGSFQDITNRKDREKEIFEGLKEREVLLQEIHHRVKNNLALVSGMLELQTFSIDNKEVIGILNDSQSRIRSIALLHEQLYDSESFSKINLQTNFSKLINYIQSAVGQDDRITINLNIDDILLNINQAVPLTLITNELLTNCYKHAFKEQKEGYIDIRITKANDILSFQLRDSGSGFPKDFDLSKTDTLGFTLVKTLNSQLNGKLDYTSNPNGTTFFLKFDIEHHLKGSSGNIR